MVALDAVMVIRNKDGERAVPAAEYFVGPDIEITRMTVLEPGDLLTAIRIPAKWAGATFYFEKVADRKTWDFPLVNIAAAMQVTGGMIEDIRLVCGAVQCTPRRLASAEDIARGSAKSEETANLAGSVAACGAVPLNYNHFKVPLMENLVKRAIRDS
jgi:xanthine dehydrogenase YagS FAD-binding subunit